MKQSVNFVSCRAFKIPVLPRRSLCCNNCDMTEEDVMTTNEAATYIGCTRRTIERYRLKGWLQPIRLANGRVLFVRQQVEKLKEELLANRYSADRAVLVQASQDPPERRSLRDDPDPLIFKPEVWDAVRRWQQSRRER